MTAFPNTRQTLVAGLICLGFSLGAAAQGTSPMPAKAGAHTAGSSVPKEDSNFVHQAAIGGMTEVKLGNIAQQQASNAQVKQFGARMVKDHSKANDELKQLASRKGIDVPPELDSKHQKDVDQLQKKQGAEFDRAYMDHMVEDHRKDVSDFRKEANAGKDPDIKAFAAKTLPTLEEHLQMAESIQAAVKKNGSDKSGSGE
jgi:putative membrane protein